MPRSKKDVSTPNNLDYRDIVKHFKNPEEILKRMIASAEEQKKVVYPSKHQ
jgi:hypothetical protein